MYMYMLSLNTSMHGNNISPLYLISCAIAMLGLWGECYHALWGVLACIVGCAGMHCGVCYHALWGVLACIVGCAGMHCGVCWHALWGVLACIVGCASMHCGVC